MRQGIQELRDEQLTESLESLLLPYLRDIIASRSCETQAPVFGDFRASQPRSS